MAGKGKKFDFHGAYKLKSAARIKEREVGGFIEERMIDGEKRYVVLTRKEKRR